MLNTSPDWDYGSCSSATSVPAATKYWCLLQGNRVSENNGATLTKSGAPANSIFTQHAGNLRQHGTSQAVKAQLTQERPDLLAYNLDVNGVGNGTAMVSPMG